jgi:hypothetical protein
MTTTQDDDEAEAALDMACDIFTANDDTARQAILGVVAKKFWELYFKDTVLEEFCSAQCTRTAAPAITFSRTKVGANTLDNENANSLSHSGLM